MEAFDEARLQVWQQQSAEFFERADIQMDGSIVETTGQCKEVDVQSVNLALLESCGSATTSEWMSINSDRMSQRERLHSIDWSS